MNEALQKTVNSALVDLISNATKAKDFLVEQIPDVIQQLLRWNFYKYLTYEILSILWISVTLYIWLHFADKYIKNEKSKSYASEDDYAMVYLLGGMSWAVINVPSFVNLNITWLQIWIAPKIYLIEYCSNLAK